MNVPAVPPPRLVEPAIVQRLRDMDSAELRGELSRALSVSAEQLMYLAQVWRELERRGENLDDLRSGLATWLGLIADGRLAAESVVQFASQRTLLRELALLPLDEQRRLAAGGTVRTLVVGADGTLLEENVPAVQLTAQQVRIAFESGRIRPPAEQLRVLSYPAAGADRLVVPPGRAPPAERSPACSPRTPRRTSPSAAATRRPSWCR